MLRISAADLAGRTPPVGGKARKRGVPVVRALNTVQIGMGVEAGFVIVLLAVILDRIMPDPYQRR